MPFKVCSVDSHVFNTLEDLKKYLIWEADNVAFLPLQNFLDKNAIFMDDEFYGRGTDWVKFNVDGFAAFCNLFNIPSRFLEKIDEPGLVSRVLNNYQQNAIIKESMARHKMVVDTVNKTVLGVVSNTYRQYSNQSLLLDIEEYFPKLLKEYKLEESYVINTNLYLRVTSPKIKAGIVTGSGGTGEDISRVGLQISNSMVGESSIKICFFILRLVCANGLIVESFNHNSKVVHSGREDTFERRLKTAISPLLKEIKTIPKIIETLASIPFQPELIVKHGGAPYVYHIIPLNKELAAKRQALRRKEKYIAFDTEVIAQYPYHYGGKYSSRVFNSRYRNNQSMFDFINVFTEYAQSRQVTSVGRRLEIEKKTGELVRWIVEKKRKLKNGGGTFEQVIL